MTPDLGESLFLFFVALALLLGLLLAGNAVVTTIGLLLARERGRPVAPPKLIMPERYAGCLVCEALDGMGDVRRMSLHQLDDHGALRW